jgi:hypothetical protein
VNVDYVDYQPENEQLLTLGYTDQKGNQRTKNVKILKLLKYLGADTSDIMGYEVEDLISYFQKGDIDNFKIVTGEQLRAAYHCENHDGDTGSCMRHTSAQPYFDMLVNNPKQVGMLVLMNPKNNKIRGRALIWNLDNGERFIDNVYVVNKEFRKDFNSYIEQNNLSKSTNDTVTLDNGGEYDEYPYLDTFMYYTPETGVLSTDETNSEGELKLDGQSGEANLPGVYSEIHNTNIPEDEAVWIAYLDTFVYDHEAEEGIDGKYVYTKDSNAKQIEKGSRYGRWAINTEDEIQWVDDYNNEVIWYEEALYIDKGSSEGYYAHENDTVTDYFHNTILRQEAIKATMGSASGERIFVEDAYIFKSGPYKGHVFHEQDENEDFVKGEYEYVNYVLDPDDYWSYEPKREMATAESIGEELTYRHANSKGVEDDKYEIGMSKSPMKENMKLRRIYEGLLNENRNGYSVFKEQMNLMLEILEMSNQTDTNDYRYYQWLLRNAKPVNVVPLKESGIDINRLNITGEECFNNAGIIAKNIKGSKFVFGFAVSPYGDVVAHGWNKIGDKYHDVTYENFDYQDSVTYLRLDEMDINQAQNLKLFSKDSKNEYADDKIFFQDFLEKYS